MRVFQKKITILILMAMSFAAGLFADEQPIWVEGESPRYPDSRFLSQVGTGDNEDDAAEDASGALKRLFDSVVKQKRKEIEKELQITSKQGQPPVRLFPLRQLTTGATNQILENVKIPATWIDSTQEVHRLAVLDRDKASQLLQAKILSEEDTIFEVYSAALENADKFVVAHNLYATIHAIVRRDTHNAHLSLVSPSGKGESFEVTLGLVGPKFRKYLSNHFKIALQIEGSHGPEVQRAIKEDLMRQQFSVPETESSTPGDILIQGNATLTRLERESANKFVRWEVQLDLINPSKGEAFGVLTQKGREAHTTFEEAEVRAIRTMIKEVMPSLMAHLSSFIFDTN